MRKLLTTLLLAAAAAGLAAAQDANPPVSDAGVARLSLIRGEVSTQRGDAGDWTAGAINQPLLSGDAVATTDGARAEIQLDFADLVRLDANSQATLAAVNRSSLQVQVGQGLVEYVVLPGADAASEIDTPNVAIRPRGRGVFRIQVNSESETVVTARSGDADVSTPEGSASLHAGQSITVDGTEQAEYQITDAAPPDEFDRWNRSRDRQLADARSWSNANHYYTGVADLDGYGRWVMVPGYGMVWSPNMAPDWTPYSVGRWVWEPYYGWTWVSAEAWGWAPYHYGRWFYYQTGWVWWPGPVRLQPMYRPVWAPAYVAFVGFHVGDVSVGLGVGRIGWVPVGPADPYRPWWGGAPAARVNITEVTNVYTVTNVRVVAPLAPVGIAVRYSNLNRMATDPRIARAVVAVPADRFGAGVVVRERVNVTEVRQAQVFAGTLPVVPTRESLRVSDRAVNSAALPRAAVERPVRFAGTRVEPMARPSFEQQQTEVRAAIAGRPMPAANGNRFAAPAGRPEAAPGARPGFRRFGEGQPAAAGRPAEAGRPAAAENNPRNAAPPSPQRGAYNAGRVQPQGNPRPQAQAPSRHPNDPSWHRFSPQPQKNSGKKPQENKKDKRGGGWR